jgi:hypothetical protein
MLTKPWELGDRQLRVFDFCTHAFEQRSSKVLFAGKGLNSPELELWLNRTIETPVAKIANGLRAGAPLRAPADWRARKALALLLFLNSQRINEARWNEMASITLQDIATSTNGLDDRVAQYFVTKFQFMLARTPHDRELFFTEAVGFAYPLPHQPVMVLPLGLHHVLLAYDGPLSAEQLGENVNLEIMSIFSIGVGTNVHRVILPPSWHELSIKDETDARDRLFELREGARRLFELTSQVSAIAGLQQWTPI